MEPAAPAWLPLALGAEEREREALAPRNVPEPPATEKLFSGSFLGALFFGYQYQGFGGVDFIALALFLFFVARMVAAKRRQQPHDRFSVERPDLRGRLGQGAENEEKQRTRVEELRPNASPEKGEPGKNPRDNVWSRRLRGESTGQQSAARRRPATVQENAAAVWAALGSQNQEQEETGAALVADGVDVPPGFDVNDFLEGSRTLYVRLQQAWAARKVDELAPFVSAQMLDLLQRQAAANPEPVPVEILLVNATLGSVSSGQEAEKAEVAFSVIMRTGQEEEAAEIDEIWLFARGEDSGGMWRLTGIRQG